MTALPAFDLAALARGENIDQLHQACTGAGFFYLVGHGVPPKLVATVEAEMHALFGLPLEQRLAISLANSRHNHGYEPLQSQSLEVGTPRDRKEGFLMGNELSPDHPHILAGFTNQGPNQWPAALPRFKPTLLAYHQALTAVAIHLMQAMAASLGLPQGYFAPFCEDPMAVLRLLHYPPQSPNPHPDEKGCGAHTDWGCLTLLWQDDTGGLQVHTQGAWIDAPPMKGAYIVNIGDMFARWTNGLYRSTPHRVINRSGRDRYSMPFFFEGAPGHPVTALPGCVAPGEAPRFAPTTVSDHLAEMYRLTYA